MKIILFIYVINSFIDFSLGSCRMKQDCNIYQSDCIPSEANFTEPVELQGINVVCNEYLGKKACCSDDQNVLLKKNFESLDSVFGASYGGCDICAINLKRLWCEFTCSPNQHEFMIPTGVGHYIIDGKNRTLFLADIILNNRMNCELFNSCKKTRYASQYVSMGNAIGFTSFQGSSAYLKADVLLNMKYTDNGGLNFKNDPCNFFPENKTTLHGFNITEPCTCNTCDLNCKYDNNPKMSIFEGFSFFKVIIVYLIVGLATLLIFFMKKRHNFTDDVRSRSSTISDMHINKADSSGAQSNLLDNN